MKIDMYSVNSDAIRFVGVIAIESKFVDWRGKAQSKDAVGIGQVKEILWMIWLCSYSGFTFSFSIVISLAIFVGSHFFFFG